MERHGDNTPDLPSPAAAELTITRASSEEWLQVEEWAAEEQWNPGVGDTACFHPTDPDGFFLGRKAGRPVSAVLVVNYSDEFAFLGYYLVVPGLRGTGLGIATWREAVPHAGERTIGLDAVPAQEGNYRRSGFKSAYGTNRYSGRPALTGTASSSVVAVTPDHLEKIAAYDRLCFPAPRRAFLERWLTADGHVARVFVRDGEVAGYGVIRRARSGQRIGPLFADTPDVAEALFEALAAHLGPDDEVHIDVPESHEAAVSLVTGRGLKPGFHTVRMYRGTPPVTRADQIFAVTTLELG